LQKIIVTGPNGAGKTHLAARLARARPDIPLVSFDAIKLKVGWKQKPRDQIDAELERHLQTDAWILEGGPSLLPLAIKHADGLIWLDPPIYKRAWRLFVRPLRFRGRTRPELPEGNVDWPVQQYKFGWRSLRKNAAFRSQIAEVYEDADQLRTWRCRDEDGLGDAIEAWRDGA